MRLLSVSFFSLIYLSALTVSYKPVIIIHGILYDGVSLGLMQNRIQSLHPGTKVYVTDKFSGWYSLTPMWRQVMEIGTDIMQIMSLHPEGVNMIGYSQGGLVARGILQHFRMHNVHNFISLSSPQCGQYGTQFLHLFFPSLTCEEAYELFYSVVGQHISVGNYWNDPHRQKLFYEYSNFLPYVNNLIASNLSDSYKSGLTKLNQMILIGGPDDEVITPWQSSHFACFGENETVVEMKDQPYYVNDTLGLRTLESKGKLKIFALSGNKHIEWHDNVTIIDNYILPYLD